jgi:DNA helicase II / ATP-dependent DNA helicase PcrA
MAKLIGSEKNTGNYGEDYLCDKLSICFDDNCIIYRNKNVFGREFDVAILIPNVGIVIFEAKGWAPSTVKRVENSDSIVIECEEGEVSQKPQKQVKGYRFAVERRIRQATGKFPLVFTMVALPQISLDFYKEKRMDVVLEEQFTLFKEDLATKAALFEKINSALSDVRLWARTPFNEDMMFEVRSIFESDLETHLEEPAKEISKAEAVKLSDYSLFQYIKSKDAQFDLIINVIADKYATGCKIYGVVEDCETLQKIIAKIDSKLTDKGLLRNKENLQVDYLATGCHFPKAEDCQFAFNAFNIAISVLSNNANCLDIPPLTILDGDIEGKESWLKQLSENSVFNLDQFLVEHADSDKGIIIRAGAGTGKTYAMISRISFVCYKNNMPIRSIIERIVMITFTNEAADQMEQRLKTHFQNYYFITSDTDYLALITKLDQMQISTIHSYTKSLISALGTEFGYGVDVDITSTQYYRRKKVSDMLDDYIAKKRREYGEPYLNKLGMPVYALRDSIIDFITKLNNKSIDVTSIEAEDFGKLSNESDGKELHDLLAYIIPQVEKDYAAELLSQNKVHLNSMMSLLNKYLKKPESCKRIKELQKGKPQFMFVDEFQDTDDTQIEMLLVIACILDYRLFLVGDIKQCIYRFRGAKERAFDQVHTEKNPDKWQAFVLRRNYRTDSKLLELYDRSFSLWGNDTDELLAYRPDCDKLLGTRIHNQGLAISKYYKTLTIDKEDLRLPTLFEEIRRLKRRVKYETDNGKNLSAKDKSIAILVRENWQAELIRKEGAKVGLSIQTNTGGDLYQATPALDMLILVNALLHFDEADYLYGLVTSNFFSLDVPKSKLYMQRKGIRDGGWRAKVDEKEQTNYLIGAMNTLLSQALADCKSWDALIKHLRLKPILQVLREIYSTLKPWQNFSDDKWKQQYYKLNVDLLFEQILSACNSDRLTINTLSEHLFNSIVAKTSVDSRTPPTDDEDIPIQCITIHKAKGLEYGHVIMPFTSFSIDTIKKAQLNVSTFHEDGKTRIGYSIIYGDGRDRVQNSYYNETVEKSERSREETRILYVAMTRAIRSFSWITLQNKNNKSWQNLIQREGK